MSDLPNPINRYEKYLNAIATGNSDDLPTPTTREEVFLDYIAKNGGGGDIPTKTSDLINDSGFITNLVNNLLNYYLKTETYSKAEVDALLQAITTLDIQAVQTLPTTNISTTTIYLVSKQDPQVPDIKDEYINLDGTTSGWELIGNTQIDLSNYVTTSDLTTALQSYVTKAYVDGLVGNLNSLTTTDKSSAVAAINEVDGKKSNSLTTEWFSLPGVSVSGGSTSDYDFDITKSGYTPLSVASFYISGGGVASVVSAYTRSGASARIRIVNPSTSTITPNDINICVLYIKND